MPGGGVALVNAAPALDKVETTFDEERMALRLLSRALEEPLRQLAANAGEDGSVVIDRVRQAQREHGSNTWGYDVLSGQLVDMFQAGIIDPAKVTRTALENAVSAAGSLLTTEALIAEVPEPKKAQANNNGRYDDMDF